MLIKRKIAAALCAVMMVSSPMASFGVMAAENVSEEGSEVVLENESEGSSETSSSHVVYGWNDESLTLHYETGYAPAWEALSAVLPTSVSANTDEGVVDVAIKGWTYNESYDVNKTGTYLIESVIDEKYALGEGVSNYAALVIIEDVNHAVYFTGLDDLVVAPGSNVNVLDGVVASDGSVEYTVGISSITAIDGSGQAVSEEEIELGEEEPVLFSVVEDYTYTVNLVALNELGEVTDADPAVRMVYVRDIVQPRAPSMQLMSIQLPANPVSGVTSIDDFSVEFVSGGSTNSGAYIWNATRATSGHQFVYMISYSTSGVGTSEPGALEIRIPLHLIKNRLGQYADTIEMSVPHEDEITEEDIEDGSVEYAYRIEGDEVVFFNVAEVSAAVNGYFEVAYSMDLSTFNYVDMAHSDEMWAEMSVGSHTADDTEWPVGIDTTAKINSTSKRFPTLYSSWQSTWGDAPADADDYYYLVWEVRSIVDDYITQPYSLEFTDVPSSDNGTVEVVAFKFSGQSSYTTNNVIPESTSSGYRYDYVLTRHSKAEFQPLDKYLIHNNVSITLTPIDGIDAPSIARSSRDFPWERPEFKYPTGHFMTYKRGDGAYRNRYNTYNYSYLTDLGFRNAKYTRYDLQEFSGKDDEEITREYLDGFDYAVWTVGYPYPWTLATGADWHDPSNFGQVPVRYEQIDEGVYLSADGGPDSDRELTSDDFQIDTLAYQVQIRDAQYNAETCVFDSITGTFLTSDILNIYTKSVNNDNNWLLSATVQLDTGVVTIVTSDRITEAENATLVNTGKTKGFITFSNNVVAYKLETSNAHYFTEIDSVPNIRLKNSQYVMETIADLDSIAIKNNVHGTVYKTTDGSVIQTWEEADKDFACVTQRDSYIRKSVVSTENNKKKRYFGINWKIAMEETVMVGNGTREYVPQSSGRFYDLLPDGMHVDTRSVAVQTEEGYLAENSYSVSVTSNYKDSGRDLLVVDIDEEAQYYNLYFTTRTDWNSIKDFGTEIYNPAAYETGNDNIKYGTIDDGGNIAESDKALMTGLDADCTTRRFIYTGERFDIAALTAATAGLTKHIKEAKDALYTTRTETTSNGEYSYRLRYMNTIRTKAKDLIFYDSLENYRINGETVDGDPLSDEFTSDWHGTLTGLDVSQMVAMGAKPVIYLSRTANLVFLNNDVGDLPDLTNTSVWKTMDQFGDISEAKAIAIDLRKKADGTDFVLDRGESAIAILQMKAPAGASSSYTRVPVSFNNIYISDTVIDLFDNEIEKYIHHDYTQIQFVVKGDITIHKTSEKDGYPIKGIKFRLRGTSDYGDEIDTFASSNRKGLLTFTDIPKGTYILSEYEGIPDYQEDHTEMTVEIDDSGKVWFTDKTGARSEITNSQAEITNKPRIHADVHIIKRDNARKGTVIPNVTFKLSGISDYGNDVVMVATTDEGGKLVFENLEQGTYELIELEAPEGYINDGRKYEVTVDQNGNVSVTGAEIEELDDTEVYNAKYAVALYGICLDEDDSGEQMGLTFGPALGADYTISFVSHTPSGKTSSGNDKRCIHNDTWDEIIEWNFKDPYVYEDCIVTGCTHSVHLDLTKAEDSSGNKLFNTTSNFLDTNPSDGAALQAQKRNGDGPSILYFELMPTNSNCENLRWNPVGSNGTNSDGWGASRMRAMLNGSDDKTTLTDGSQSSDVHKSASVYTEDNCLFACFPKELQEVIGYRAVKYDSVYNTKTNANLKIAADRLWLLSPNEIWTAEAIDKADSSKYYSHPLEGSQYPYFKTKANSTNAGTSTLATRNYRVKNFSGSGSASTYSWWLRSSRGSSSSNVLCIFNNGNVRNSNANNCNGAAPCFSLSRSEIISDSLSAPSNEGNQFALYNEKKHSFDFSKVSAFDNSGLEGATFRLTGTSNYGTKVDVTATSQGTNGTVRFEDLESGVYTLTEIEAPDGYIKDEKQYPVIIYRNDTVKIEGMPYDETAKTYKLQNIKKKDQGIVVTKVWHDKSNNMIRPMPRIILSTTVPQGRRTDFTVVYHANDDANASFSGDATHEIMYEQYKYTDYSAQKVEIAHSDNILDSGTRLGGYTDQITKKKIVIPGAASLTVDIWYGVGSNANNSYLAVYDGTMSPSVDNATSANVSNGKLTGNTTATKPADTSTYHKTYTVTGDTVQFLFVANTTSSFNYYGYWAEIKGVDAGGNPINGQVKTEYTERGTNTYEKPNTSDEDKAFGGWYTAATNPAESDIFEMTGAMNASSSRLPISDLAKMEKDDDEKIHVYAKWKTAPFTMYAVSVYGIGVDTDEQGRTMGLTFGPALGTSYVTTYKSHTPDGTTTLGNAHRCLHADDWNTIIQWNNTDPEVYEQCISEGCTHGVKIRLSRSENFNPDFVFSKTGDGVSVLYNELVVPTNVDENLRWHPNNNRPGNSDKYGTNYEGWGASRIRAMLNGADELTDIGDGTENGDVYATSASSDIHKSASYYTAANCLFNCFPNELKAAIGKRATKYDSVYNSKTAENLKTTYDKLWFLSSNEIWTQDLLVAANETYYAHPLEGSQYPYFTTRMGTITKATTSNNNLRGYYINNQTGSGSASAVMWWLRSSWDGNDSHSVLCVNNYGYVYGSSAYSSYGAAPCFSLSSSAGN